MINSPSSIYGHLSKYMSESSPNPSFGEFSGQMNYFLNQFYLRLTAQTYCKIKNISMSSRLTPTLKQELLEYIGEEYKNHSPAAIMKVES